jgi:hypothetical protein
MEVFIRRVSKRETEESLKSFLGNVLRGLSIEDWGCGKRAQKDWAKLFFLNLEDGRRFLRLHGQTDPGSTNLVFKGRQLRCSISNSLDTFALRSLEMDKIAKAEHKTAPANSKEMSSRKAYQVLACASISCGLWDYIEDELVFKPYHAQTKSANLTFKSRFILFKTGSGQRLDISYQSIEAVV